MIRKGTVNDITEWRDLVKQVSHVFPGLETEEKLKEHKRTVLKFIDKGEAVCSTDDSLITGVLLYSKKHNMICCLAVSPEYRERGIASAMLQVAFGDLDRTREIKVSTFREGDEKGIAARTVYTKFGFQPEELILEYGYPNQVFRLHP